MKNTITLQTKGLTFHNRLLFPPFTLSIRTGKTSIFMGHNGAGKTTLLKAMAGLPHDFQDFRLLFPPSLPHPSIGYYPQNATVFPHLTVKMNLCIGYLLRGEPVSEKKLQEVITLCQLQSLASHNCQTLSGGEASRVAMGRVLMENPDVILMDEPFNALDVSYRLLLQKKIHTLFPHKTILMVTHSINEAALLGHDIFLFQAPFKPKKCLTQDNCGLHDKKILQNTSLFLQNALTS